jgi:tRNA-specific 2-thiouridylase
MKTEETEATRRRVIVGLSGGVDSAVAAALLVEQGYDVVGMMLRLWNDDGCETENRCCTPEAMDEARKVAGRLGIPFYALDAQDLFFREIVGYFLSGYERGVTPNPCLRCNPITRWGFLLSEGEAIGATALATGHYAQVHYAADGFPRLYRGVDANKDQSYVLAFLTPAQLEKTILPLGGMTKSEVRAKAAALGLSVAHRPDSQDLCFLGDKSYHDFLRRLIPHSLRPGAIVTRAGKQIGRHEGLPLYTIGQRKGIQVASPDPLYVLEKDRANNRLVVGRKEELGRSEFWVRKPNWLVPESEIPTEAFSCQVKTRYKAPLVEARVEQIAVDLLRVICSEPGRDITPGQGAAFYMGDMVLAAGEIELPEESSYT